MPEYSQLAAAQFALGIGANGLVHAEVLMITGKDFCGFSAGVVKQNEIFQKIEEVFLAADTAQHNFQGYASGFIFFKAFPFMKEFILAAQRADFCFQPIGKNEECITIKELGNSIEVVGVVFNVGFLHINIGPFQLYEEKRKTVDKTHDIRPTAVQIAVNFEFLNGQEVIGSPAFESR